MTPVAGSTWAIVVAAGAGRRFGGPKQWLPLGDRRVVDWSVAAARAAADGVVLVVSEDDVLRSDLPPADRVVAGGPTRSASVRAGLAAVPQDAVVVVVHDAARPLAPASLFAAAVAAVAAGADGAVCAVPVADTLKRVVAGRVVDTVAREGLWAVQTPQAFRADRLREAHMGDPEATDDAALVEATGGAVAVVEGDARNRKITDALDLVMAEALIR